MNKKKEQAENLVASHGSVDSIEPSRRATFRAAAKGLRAYTIALRLRDANVRPGVDFRGCSKRELEDDFATESGLLRHLNGNELRKALGR